MDAARSSGPVPWRRRGREIGGTMGSAFAIAVVIVALLLAYNGVKIVREYQRLVVFRLGRSIPPACRGSGCSDQSASFRRPADGRRGWPGRDLGENLHPNPPVLTVAAPAAVSDGGDAVNLHQAHRTPGRLDPGGWGSTGSRVAPGSGVTPVLTARPADHAHRRGAPWALPTVQRGTIPGRLQASG